MDYVYTERGVKQVAYNNYLKMAKAIFNWMVEKCYAKENPFAKIKPKAKTTKTRILIPSDTRSKIITHLRIVNPQFLLVCKLMYYSLIRPKEILSVRLEDISIASKTIRITADNAKNGKQRYCAITQDIINDLLDMRIFDYPKSHYLFGSSLTPCATPAGDARLRKDWDKVRNQLKLPAEMQLYSFRDTGITEMLKSGIDDLTVMQHADHHSLDMTTIYSSHADPNLVNTIYERAPQF
jgi:integrase